MPPLQWAVFEANLDPVQGSEQAGVRPVLVVSCEEFNQVMPNIAVLPLTSTKRRLYPFEVLLEQGKTGQPRDSIVLAHQIRTISKLRLRRRFGSLEEVSLQDAVGQALKDFLDLA